jgi:ribosomal protein S18 acetylase RimI-like enzyme
MQLRRATAADIDAVAALHADSWRRHYRGAYPDEFLDGDLLADRLAVWTPRLSAPDGAACTVLAEDGGALLGFVHARFDADPAWGTLVDNLHVSTSLHRTGIGRTLMREVATTVAEERPAGGVYLWVLEQNNRARAFYAALGGECVERATLDPPGIPTAVKLRIVWPDAEAIAA